MFKVVLKMQFYKAFGTGVVRQPTRHTAYVFEESAPCSEELGGAAMLLLLFGTFNFIWLLVFVKDAERAMILYNHSISSVSITRHAETPSRLAGTGAPEGEKITLKSVL